MTATTGTSVTLTINGTDRHIERRGSQTLLGALRDEIGLTGTKRGCNQGVCGACTVLIDGESVRSCLTLALACEGRRITTIEGVAHDGKLAPIQQALIDANAVQCGFCTSGIVLSAHAFLERNPNPSAEAVRAALSGNLCRCSGYKKIVDAVLLAAQRGAP
ncbi:MAG: (2Fe-2S)-binding protein [Gammaproteobacteria bacterium]